MQVQSSSPARGSLPGPSRRITVEPIEVPVTPPRAEPAPPPPDREPAPARAPPPPGGGPAPPPAPRQPRAAPRARPPAMTAGRPGEMPAPDLVQPVIGYRL